MLITVRAHEGIGIGSRFVRAWTRSPWGHVDLVFESASLVLDVRPSVGLALTPFYDVPVMGPCITRTYVVHDFVGAEALSAICCEQGSPYDWFGAAAAGMPWVAREDPKAWFCSEAVWHVMGTLGLATDAPAWRRTPNDISELINLPRL